MFLAESFSSCLFVNEWSSVVRHYVACLFTDNFLWNWSERFSKPQSFHVLVFVVFKRSEWPRVSVSRPGLIGMGAGGTFRSSA